MHAVLFFNCVPAACQEHLAGRDGEDFVVVFVICHSWSEKKMIWGEKKKRCFHSPARCDAPPARTCRSRGRAAAGSRSGRSGRP